MKKSFILILSAISAFLLTELLLTILIRYPKWAEDKVIIDMYGPGFDGGLYDPYSGYLTVEGGIRAFSRNNLGLQGIQVDTLSDTKYIFVNGTSYIEAMQVQPESMATSVFQERLGTRNTYQVLNLGKSGICAYGSYFASAYFEKIYRPEVVILVIDDLYPEYFSKYRHPLDFHIQETFGTVKEKYIISQLRDILRKHSGLTTLIFDLLDISKIRKTQNITDNNQKTPVVGPELIPQDLLTTIDEFELRYGKKFLCTSIINNKDINRQLNKYCDSLQINFASQSINVAINKIRHGHLNNRGNMILGDFLYESFTKYYQK